LVEEGIKAFLKFCLNSLLLHFNLILETVFWAGSCLFWGNQDPEN